MLTAAAHVADAMAAVRRRIQSLNTGPFSATPIAVEIGAPATFHPRDDGATPLVTIFVYRIEFDNAAYLSTPTGAQALRLHALLTAFCAAGVDRSESAGSFELRILSHIIRLFMEQPQLGPVRVPNALPVGPAAALIGADLMITAQPRMLDVEDMNHIWTTQGETPYRTSLCYLFSFGIVPAAQPSDDGPPVLFPVLVDPLDPASVGVHPGLPAQTTPAPSYGAVVLNLGTHIRPTLVTEARFVAGGGDFTLQVAAITETPEALILQLEVWGPNGWEDASDRLAQTVITSLARRTLQGGTLLTTSPVTLDDDGNAAVLRLSATRAAQPQMLIMNGVTITMGAAP